MVIGWCCGNTSLENVLVFLFIIGVFLSDATIVLVVGVHPCPLYHHGELVLLSIMKHGLVRLCAHTFHWKHFAVLNTYYERR